MPSGTSPTARRSASALDTIWVSAVAVLTSSDIDPLCTRAASSPSSRSDLLGTPLSLLHRDVEPSEDTASAQRCKVFAAEHVARPFREAAPVDDVGQAVDRRPAEPDPGIEPARVRPRGPCRAGPPADRPAVPKRCRWRSTAGRGRLGALRSSARRRTTRTMSMPTPSAGDRRPRRPRPPRTRSPADTRRPIPRPLWRVPTAALRSRTSSRSSRPCPAPARRKARSPRRAARTLSSQRSSCTSDPTVRPCRASRRRAAERGHGGTVPGW
jgi:hypothetical protein